MLNQFFRFCEQNLCCEKPFFVIVKSCIFSHLSRRDYLSLTRNAEMKKRRLGINKEKGGQYLGWYSTNFFLPSWAYILNLFLCILRMGQISYGLLQSFNDHMFKAFFLCILDLCQLSYKVFYKTFFYHGLIF